MKMNKLSPEQHHEKMPELAERLRVVTESISRARQVISWKYPEELAQREQPEFGQADSLPSTEQQYSPNIKGVGHSEMTAENVTDLREAISRMHQQGESHDTQQAA
jgi:hypothetical protein